MPDPAVKRNSSAVCSATFRSVNGVDTRQVSGIVKEEGCEDRGLPRPCPNFFGCRKIIGTFSFLSEFFRPNVQNLRVKIYSKIGAK